MWRFCVDGLGQASGGSIRRSVVDDTAWKGRPGLCEDFVWTDLGRVLAVLCEDFVWTELGRERTARSEDLLWKTLHGRGGGTFVKILCGRIWEGRLLAVPFGRFRVDGFGGGCGLVIMFPLWFCYSMSDSRAICLPSSSPGVGLSCSPPLFLIRDRRFFIAIPARLFRDRGLLP